MSSVADQVIKYSYHDVPTIEAFSRSNARIRGIVGPFRSGKSSGSVMEIASRGCAQKPSTIDGVRRSRWIVVRNTFAQLADSTIKTFFMWFPPERCGRYTSSDHNYVIKALKGETDHKTEIEVWFRALDRPDHVRNLLSVEVTGAWVNEGREIPWSIVEALDGRIGQYPNKAMGGPTFAGLWLDTNPPDVDSKWYRFFEEMKHDPRRVQLFHQPSGLAANAENLTNLPSRTYYHDLAYGKDPNWIKVYIHGQYGYVNEGKAIYPEYVDGVHCKEANPVPGIPIYRGWDYGLTPACVFMQELPDGRWLVFDEMVSDNMGIDQFSDDVLEHCANFRWAGHVGAPEYIDIGDPAGDQRSQNDLRTAFEIQQSKGIMIRGGPQDPRLRQESVRWLLRQHVQDQWEPRFVIHPRCKVTRKGFQGGYHRRRLQVAGAERYSDQAEKNLFSHPHDALQYPVADRYGEILVGRLGMDDDYDIERPLLEGPGTSSVTGY